MQTVMVQSHGLQRRLLQSEATCVFDTIDEMGVDVTGANFAPTGPVYVRVPLVRTNRINLNNYQGFEAAIGSRESAPTSQPAGRVIQPARGAVAQPFQPPKIFMPQLSYQMGESGTTTRPSTPVEEEAKTRPGTPVPGETPTRPCTPVLEMGAGPSAPQPVVFGSCFAGIPSESPKTCVERVIRDDHAMTSPSTHAPTYSELPFPPHVNGFAHHHPENGSIAAHSFLNNSSWQNASIMTAPLAHPAESVSGFMPAAPTSFLGWGEPVATTSRNLIPHTDAFMNDNRPQTYPSFAIPWNSGFENANLVLQARSDHMAFVRFYSYPST